jgi:zinc protease
MASARKALKPARGSLYKRAGTYHGVEEYVLKKNGLRVLYRHDDSAPVVGLMVTYLVGSRHEATGHTGATHLLEHLMFKGSKNFPKKKGVSVLDRFQEKGALINATTWFDRTNYYEVMPKEHIEFAVRVEADRMRNAIITRADLDEEMPAVRSEYARGENDPYEALDKHVWATAFVAHPYHHSTIGWLPDIENVSIERLKQFYDTYYWPNNAVVSIVGDIERERALEIIATHFGVHSSSPHTIPTPYTSEPSQLGRRFVEVSRAGTQNLVGIAFKVPDALHADTASLIALADILAGGNTSRLHKALVEKQLASGVSASYMPLHDPSLFTVYATLVPGISHTRVEQTIMRTIRMVVEKSVTAGELARVLSGARTSIAVARDGQFAMLSALNEAIAVGNWRYYFDMPDALAKVTPVSVRRVATTYLIETSSTVGHYKGVA